MSSRPQQVCRIWVRKWYSVRVNEFIDAHIKRLGVDGPRSHLKTSIVQTKRKWLLHNAPKVNSSLVGKFET